MTPTTRKHLTRYGRPASMLAFIAACTLAAIYGNAVVYALALIVGALFIVVVDKYVAGLED